MVIKNSTVTKELTQRLDVAQRIRKHRSSAWWVSLFYFYNRMKLKVADGGDIVIAPPHDRTVWKPIPYRPVNLTLKLYQARLARMLNIPIEFVVNPGSMALDDQIAAEYAERIIKGVILPKILRIREELLFWTILTDRTLVKVRWDKKLDGDVKLTVIPPTQYLIDPMALGQDVFSPDAESPARWVAHEKLVTGEHLISVYGVSEKYLDELPSTNTPAVNDLIRKIMDAKKIPMPESGEKYFKIYEYWEIPSYKHPKGRLITFIADSDVILQNSDLPEPCLNLRRLPFVDFVEILTPDSYYGLTAIELAAPLLKSYSETASQIAQLVNDTGVTTAFIQGSEGTALKAEPFDADTADKVVKYTGVQPPVLSTKEPFSVGLLRRLDQLLMEIEMVTGISELKYPLRERTATEIVKSEEYDNTRNSVFVGRYIRGLTDVVTIALEFIKSYYTFGRKIEVLGEYGIPEIISFDRSKLDKNFNIVIANAGLATSSKFERLVILQQLGQIAALLLSDPRMREKYVDMFGRIFDDLLETGTRMPIQDQYNIRQARQENLLVFYNGPTQEIKAEPFQNHKLHIQEHTTFLLQKYNDPKMPTFSIQKLQSHIEEHQQFLIKGAQNLLAFQSQAGLPVQAGNVLQAIEAGGLPGGQAQGGSSPAGEGKPAYQSGEVLSPTFYQGGLSEQMGGEEGG